MTLPDKPALIAGACGGTGGHLFPGIAVGEVLQEWGCDVALLVSQKEVDQEAVKSAVGMQVLSVPAVALQGRRWRGFVSGAWHSYRLCRRFFQEHRPRAVLAMGGFTSAPAILAAKGVHAATFLHESNAIPGRANRWLAPWVDGVFVGFAVAARLLRNQAVHVVGTPVRAQFKPSDAGPCRMALGLDPNRPVLLIMGGSQGARGINELVTRALPILGTNTPELQFLHLTGFSDYEQVRQVYASHNLRAVVRPFVSEMELALGAATVAISRAGASSLAELAAMLVPALLIPYPHAWGDHQSCNAGTLVQTGAARQMAQGSLRPEALADSTLSLVRDAPGRAAMQEALKQWCFPNAARATANRNEPFLHCRPT